MTNGLSIRWSLLLLITLLTTAIPTSAVPGESFDEPIVIFEGVTTGSISGNASIWYKVSLDGNYDISLNASHGTDFDMVLYNSSKVSIDSAQSVSYPDSMKLYSLLGDYYIEVYAYSGTGDFDLTIASFPKIPGDNERNPITLSEDSTTGYLSGTGDVKWYNVTLTGNYMIELVAEDETDFDIHLYDQPLELIDSVIIGTYPRELQMYNLHGSFLLRIRSSSGGGHYNLSIISFPVVPGDHFTNPILVAEGEYAGDLPGPSQRNTTWYQINLRGTYRIMLQGSDITDFDLELYTMDLGIEDSARNSRYPDIIITEDLTGPYLIQIISVRGQGWYRLYIEEISSSAGFIPDTAIEINGSRIDSHFPGPAVDLSIWYKVDLTGSHTIILEDTESLDLDLYVYDSSVILIDSSEMKTSTDRVVLENAEGLYYIKVKYNSGKLNDSFSLIVSQGISFRVTSARQTSNNGGSSGLGTIIVVILIVVAIIGVGNAFWRSLRLAKSKTASINESGSITADSIPSKPCQSCGELNKVDNLFCVECGSSML